MRNHIKVFTTFWNTGNVLSQSYQCFVCSEWNAVDIHHISGRGMGGSKNDAKNYIENIPIKTIYSNDIHWSYFNHEK